jgi:hypothetical protein
MKFKSTAPLALSCIALACAAGAAQASDRSARSASAEDRFSREAQAAKPAEQRVGMISGRVNPQVQRAADGTLSLELDASTMVYSVARINAQGKLEYVCVYGAEAAEAAVKAPPSFAKRMVAASSRPAQEKFDDK